MIASFRLVDPLGEEIAATSGNAQTTNLAFSSGARVGVKFPVAGTYRLMFGLDRDPVEVYSFDVALIPGHTPN